MFVAIQSPHHTHIPQHFTLLPEVPLLPHRHLVLDKTVGGFESGVCKNVNEIGVLHKLTPGMT